MAYQEEAGLEPLVLTDEELDAQSPVIVDVQDEVK